MMLCLNSRESFEDNKRFLKSQMEQEENPVIRRLLEQDQTHLDRIQVQMATAREFLIMLRLKDEKESDIFPYLCRVLPARETPYHFCVQADSGSSGAIPREEPEPVPVTYG